MMPPEVLGEKFVVRKKVRGRFRIALVYPCSYKVAVSNLGMRIIYHLLNLDERIYCERFTNESDRSLETGSHIREFDLVMFCYQYELDLFEIARWIIKEDLFDKPKIVGGPCVYNPFPLRGLVDYVYLGEAEASLTDFVDSMLAGADADELSRIKGILDLKSLKPSRRAYPNPLNTFLPALQVSSRLSVFGDALLVDVSRGCRWACKFCLGRCVYAPYRERPLDQLVQVIEEGLERGSYESLALISSDLNSYSRLDELLAFIESMLDRGRFRLIAPSIRADTIDERLIELLVKSGEKTITLAPESSEELRHRIGKPFSDEQLIEACKLLKKHGVEKVKLYFMFGLPDETAEDLKSIIKLVSRIKEIGLKLRVSANPFVPKPHTPFEDEVFRDPKELKASLRYLRKELGGILTTDGIRQAFLQAMIARGDEKIGRLILETAKLGEKPSLSLLKKKARELGIDLAQYARYGSENEPWKSLKLS